jgi:PilZ domain
MDSAPDREHQNRQRRRYPRVPIITPVEFHPRERTGPPLIGRIENLSAGGMLAACREPLEPRTELAMLFTLPTGQSIQAFGRVIYTLPVSRYGIEFMDLDGDALQQVEQFTHKVLGYRRRSSRVPHRTSLVIRDSKDSPDLELAETALVSRNGGLLVCRGTYNEGQEIYLWAPECHRGARARVVFQQVWASDTIVELGFEFLESTEIWDISFEDEST